MSAKQPHTLGFSFHGASMEAALEGKTCLNLGAKRCWLGYSYLQESQEMLAASQWRIWRPQKLGACSTSYCKGQGRCWPQLASYQTTPRDLGDNQWPILLALHARVFRWSGCPYGGRWYNGEGDIQGFLGLQ